MSALRELRERVAAGEFPDDFLAIDSKCELGKVTTASLYAAFSGSLDAAKTLHEALLPEWAVTLELDTGTAWADERRGLRRMGYRAVVPGNPARAWLLAIHDALIEKEKDDG